MFSHFQLVPKSINCKLSLLSFLAVDFLDTGQSQDEGLLSVNGSVDGSPADLKDGVMAYCPEQTNPLCMVNCTVGFPTMHSPSYFLNGSCFSAGGSGEGLQEFGVQSSRPEHPKYSIHFPCNAISNYTCYLNDTLYTHVGIRPGKSFQHCGTCMYASIRVLFGLDSKLDITIGNRTGSGALFPDLVMPHSIIHTVLITQE